MTPLIWAGLFIAGLLITTLLDRWAYLAMLNPPWDSPSSLIEMLQAAGHLPTWILVATALLLIERRKVSESSRRLAWRRAWLLIWPGLLAGAGAALVKTLVRRERPWYTDGTYEFRWLTDSEILSSGGLGMPSSHSAVAFAVLFVLARLYPAATPVWLILGLGCGLSRLERGAHFLSDVYVGAALGCLCGLLAWRWFTRQGRLARRARTESPAGA